MNKNIKIIIAVVAIILIGGAVYANTKTQKSDQKMITLTGSVDTKDWKTYTSEKYRFAFKYPANWNVVSSYPESILISSPEKQKQIDSKPNENLKNYDVIVSVYNGTPAIQSDTYKIEDTTLDGKQIKKVWSVGPDSGPFESVMYTNNGSQISFSYPKNALETKIVTSFATSSTEISTGDWKTYVSKKESYSFEYPEKLSLASAGNVLYLLHEISFDNHAGGCDMKGDSELSKTLNDFNVSIEVVNSVVKPPYVDGTFSKGALAWEWAYQGAEGCGETIYYYPMNGNRTLILRKKELQILSPIVAKEVREKLLKVPGVISNEESQAILEKILTSFQFTK